MRLAPPGDFFFGFPSHEDYTVAEMSTAHGGVGWDFIWENGNNYIQ